VCVICTDSVGRSATEELIQLRDLAAAVKSELQDRDGEGDGLAELTFLFSDTSLASSRPRVGSANLLAAL